jgi:hypothetical protein
MSRPEYVASASMTEQLCQTLRQPLAGSSVALQLVTLWQNIRCRRRACILRT